MPAMSNRSKTAVSILVMLLLPAFSSCATKKDGAPRPRPAAVLEVSPLEIQPIRGGSFSDAVDSLDKLGELKSIIVFKIEKVVSGKLPKIEVEAPFKMDQMKNAIRNKDFKSVILSDYDTAGAEVERQRFRVAVKNPMTVFGFDELSIPSSSIFRIELARYHKEEDTYVLQKTERIQ